MTILPWVAATLILLGGIFSLLGAVGVLRLPDAYTRMHSASKAGALGAILVLLGALAATDGARWFAVLLAVLVVLMTAPMAAHAISRAGHRAGFKPEVGPLGDALEHEEYDQRHGL
ncbi:monovalent cation/H(+) antiporter subunit G [Halopseudomonas salegens]|uniref:Multicomponent Na+:H+ antiporter subunit G n=1 Tax=Halopseudomonas salegens TaxID=1434072 RepID=A0A1H2FZW2_9GAMM|nr:monovalent cation/H(+) antiporter subunit G [Halopseudomonas salegens]SDU12853.1 multicomponent Na+:H+ antiporter subunit G [Halopseudomonas salegens]